MEDMESVGEGDESVVPWKPGSGANAPAWNGLGQRAVFLKILWTTP